MGTDWKKSCNILERNITIVFGKKRIKVTINAETANWNAIAIFVILRAINMHVRMFTVNPSSILYNFQLKLTYQFKDMLVIMNGHS